MIWWEKQRDKLQSCGAQESRGCERQMGEAGASVFSSCLLAHTLTTRLQPLQLSLFVFLSLLYPSTSFSDTPLSPCLTPVSLHFITFLLQTSCSMCWMTFSNHPVRNTSTDGWRSHPPTCSLADVPRCVQHMEVTHPLKCVTHITNVLNECIKIHFWQRLCY